MELFLEADFLSALLAIVVIDLVLAGDNALVIGLAARDLPKHMQRKVILWGTAGAIIVRALMTIGVVWLLKIPGLLLVGGLALVWIARKLLTPADESASKSHAAARTLGEAIRIIVIADAVMGVDNVIAVGGAARESELLVILGLLISVPIMVWGSTIVLRIVTRYPAAIVVGGLVLAWTAFSMVIDDQFLAPWLERSPALKLALGLGILAMALAPWLERYLSTRHRPLLVLLPGLAIWLLGFHIAGELLGWHLRYIDADASLGEMALQLLKWLGWIPLAVAWLSFEHHRKARRQRRDEMEAMNGGEQPLPARVDRRT
jgi:YjbE family integral membrane protein